MIIGNGIDRQTLQGITVYDGNANTIIGNSFHSNGTSANNTYGHIDLAAGVTQVVISDNNFGPQDSGEPNVASYCVVTESGITTGSIIGNIGQADTSAYATAFISAAGSNTSPSVLLSKGGAMIRNTQSAQHVFQIENHAGTIIFDMTDAGTFSVNDGAGKFQAGISGGNGHTPQSITGNGATILTPATHCPVTCTGNYTGTILTAGAEDGQLLTVVNISTSSGTLTFAAAGTSGVAQGASLTIPVNGKQVLVWDASTSLWY
jgi:parallel beta-helix repeat protein